MSAFHNSIAGEQVAKKFHLVCAIVGLVHFGLGAAIVLWHLRGYRDHCENLERLRADN